MTTLTYDDTMIPDLPLVAVAFGPPQAMGSKSAFVRNGRAIVTDQKGQKLKDFQTQLRWAMKETAPKSLILGPVRVALTIVIKRPKSHYGTGKNAAKLKDSAPVFCTSKPDADKVLRSCLDCGTGIWWRDDSQVCVIGTLTKRYASDGEIEYTKIEARELS